MAWTKNFTLPTNFNNNNPFDTSSVLTPDMFNVPYQNTLYLKDHLDIVEGNLSNIDDSLYNLGAYDTITANADGSYTITRQTGYLVLDGVKHKVTVKYGTTDNGMFANYDLKNYALIPSSSDFSADIICNRFKTYPGNTIYSQNIYGISITADGTLAVGLTTAITTLDEANAYLVQNPISIQYKLATATTEKVEKNHYARYNERFILEHNKSEAERSANLLNIADKAETTTNGITYSIKDGVITLNGTSTATLNFERYDITKLFNQGQTYFIKQFTDNENIKVFIGRRELSTSDEIYLQAPITFTYNGEYSIRLFIQFTKDVTYNNTKASVSIVKGSTAPTTYQPYNQNKHITNNEAEFLKTEYDRSANLMPLGTWTNGKGFTSDGGDNSSTDLNRCEDYISVLGNKEYIYKQNITITNYTIVEYDVNKNFIQTQASITSSFITNANTRYIRIATYISGGSSLPTKCMLNEGSIALPYQEYEGKIVHLKDLELYGTKPAIANVQCPIDLSKWNDNRLSYSSSGSSVPDLHFDYDALGYIYLLPTRSSGSMTKGIVRYTGGDTDAFTWSISAITNNYIELSCATKFFLDGPASSRGTLKTANYVLEIEDMYGHTFSLPFSVNYRKN